MDEKTAAAYLGLGAATLRKLLARLGVEPLALGARVKRWRRADLDAAIATLPFTRRTLLGESCAPDESGVDLALAAVERRVSSSRRRNRMTAPR